MYAQLYISLKKSAQLFRYICLYQPECITRLQNDLEVSGYANALLYAFKQKIHSDAFTTLLEPYEKQKRQAKR